MRRLALFDLDNTLADRTRAFRRWCEVFVEEHRLDPSIITRLVELDDDGRTSREDFFQAITAEFAVNEQVGVLVASYRTRYPGQFYRSDPATLAGLMALRRAGWKVAVVTNGPASQEDKMRITGLCDVVDAWCVSDVVGTAKPEAQIFEEAAHRCGVALSGWMVGDSADTDIAGGIGVGLSTAWLTRGRSWDEPRYQPEVLVDSIGDAIGLILADAPDDA